ncbi:MAG TPA: CapA family protein [Candidatus Dormibacteraeota bacterium]|nr:CapA family protein [Candidatus Dormibacteraeota bacterium]
MTKLAFLGDTLLGGEAQPVLDENGSDWALEEIRTVVRDADLVVANHEGPLTERIEPAHKTDTQRKRYWYRAPPSAAAVLRGVGVKVVSLANNHILDFGLEGLQDTIASLDAAGIAHSGAGLDETAAREPAIVEVGPWRIGFLSYLQRYEMYRHEGIYARGGRGGCARLRSAGLRGELAALRRRADLCVALVHWGRNYRPPSIGQRRWAAALREAGADLIVGHHPHIPQPVLIEGRVPVFLSLGNAALGTPGRFHSGRPPYGMVGLVDLDDNCRVSAIGIRLLLVDNARVNFRPRLVEGSEATEFLWSLVNPAASWREVAGGGLCTPVQYPDPPAY